MFKAKMTDEQIKDTIAEIGINANFNTKYMTVKKPWVTDDEEFGRENIGKHVVSLGWYNCFSHGGNEWNTYELLFDTESDAKEFAVRLQDIIDNLTP